MSNKVYDVLSYISKIALPALGTLYFALCGIWGLPFGEEVVGTITAIDTFLGAILVYNKIKYERTTKILDEQSNAVSVHEEVK